MIKIVIPVFLVLCTVTSLYSQNPTVFSRLLNLNLPDQFIKESNSFALFAGQTVLEMETQPQGITLEEVELFTWKNPSGNLAESELMLNSVLENVTQAGWKVTLSPRDRDYRWLVQKNEYLVGYFTITVRETAVYIGKASQVPPFVKTFSNQSEPPQILRSSATPEPDLPIPAT
jgi:hypothetical protein